ncbi:MAG TPA: M28 family peptidase [Bacteroidales bacterium]|nr:M28 family peptidase [Bacteroidales bacterium]
MHKTIQLGITLLIGAFGILSCGAGSQKKAEQSEAITVNTTFDADSAYSYVEKQTSFGPRVPNTKEHADCKEYLTKKMRDFGAKTVLQDCELISWDGTKLHATNIIASFQPEKTKRIVLCSHWDSRPWADQDANQANWHSPIDGANDGASGVGVLLEIGRQLQMEAAKGRFPNYGIDILFLDAEDLGTPRFSKKPDNESTWCLGTQYWAKEAKKSGYQAEFGILLDMVGGKAPNFMWDYYSLQYAPQVLQRVWASAATLGYNSYFVPAEGGAITDDHLYVNRIAGIPCIDIIDYNPSNGTGFVSYWHTMDDTMKNIDKNSLKMVGETLLNVIFNP